MLLCPLHQVECGGGEVMPITDNENTSILLRHQLRQQQLLSIFGEPLIGDIVDLKFFLQKLCEENKKPMLTLPHWFEDKEIDGQLLLTIDELNAFIRRLKRLGCDTEIAINIRNAVPRLDDYAERVLQIYRQNGHNPMTALIPSRVEVREALPLLVTMFVIINESWNQKNLLNLNNFLYLTKDEYNRELKKIRFSFLHSSMVQVVLIACVFPLLNYYNLSYLINFAEQLNNINVTASAISNKGVDSLDYYLIRNQQLLGNLCGGLFSTKNQTIQGKACGSDFHYKQTNFTYHQLQAEEPYNEMLLLLSAIIISYLVGHAYTKQSSLIEKTVTFLFFISTLSLLGAVSASSWILNSSLGKEILYFCQQAAQQQGEICHPHDLVMGQKYLASDHLPLISTSTEYVSLLIEPVFFYILAVGLLSAIFSLSARGGALLVTQSRINHIFDFCEKIKSTEAIYLAQTADNAVGPPPAYEDSNFMVGVAETPPEYEEREGANGESTEAGMHEVANGENRESSMHEAVIDNIRRHGFFGRISALFSQAPLQDDVLPLDAIRDSDTVSEQRALLSA